MPINYDDYKTKYKDQIVKNREKRKKKVSYTEYQNNKTTTPVKKTTTEAPVKDNKKWYQKFFKGSEAFDDGYDFGDVSKTILGTAADLENKAAKGVLSILEAPVDIASYGAYAVTDILGADKTAKKIKSFADRSLSTEFANKYSQNHSIIADAYVLTDKNQKTYQKVRELEKQGKQDEAWKVFKNSLKDSGKEWLSLLLPEVSKGTGLKEEIPEEYFKIIEDNSISGDTTDKAAELIGYVVTMGGVTKGLDTAFKGTKTLGSVSTNAAGKTIGTGATLGASNIGVTVAGKTLNLPTLAVAGGMSSGLNEAYQKEDVTHAQAWTKGLTSGAIEGVTEGMFGMLGVGGNELTDQMASGLAKKFSSSFGKQAANLTVKGGGEAFEELTSYTLNWLTDNNVIDKMEGADFKSEFDWEDASEQMALALISSGALQGGATGLQVNAQVNEIINAKEQELGRKLTKTEKKAIRSEAAQKIIDAQNNQETPAQVQVNEQVQEDIAPIKENAQNIENNVQNDVVNNNEISNTVQNVQDIDNQIAILEEQLMATENEVEYQRLSNQIKELEIRAEQMEQQQEIAPIKAASVEQVNQPTTQETNSNSLVEVESNTQEVVKSPVVEEKSPVKTENVVQVASDTQTQNIEVEKTNSRSQENDSKTTSKQQVMTEEEYLASKGYGFMGYSEAGLHKGSKNESKRSRQQAVDLVQDRAAEYDAKRQELRKEYQEMLERGEIRKPTSIEKSLKVAQGLEDNPSVLAARRTLAKRGIDWRTGEALTESQVQEAKKTPTQEELDNLEYTRKNKSGSEYASAFYDLEKKYGSANLYKGLNNYKSTGKALVDDIAPIKEELTDLTKDLKSTIKDTKKELKALKTELNEVKTDINNVVEEYKAMTEEQANERDLQQNRLQSITDEDIAPVREDTTPEYEFENNNEGTPTEVASPLENRDFDEVGSRKVKAYQYEHPEVRPYFQEAAKLMLGDLYGSTKGERIIDANVLYETNGESGIWGVRRNTTYDIAQLLDSKYNYSYADIEKGLKAIIEDHGAENIAVAKRIEFALDERLREGYVDVDGYEIPADQNYINLLRENEWENYYNSIPQNDDIAPYEAITEPITTETTQDDAIAPVIENVAEMPLNQSLAIEEAPVQEEVDNGGPMLKVSPEMETKAIEVKDSTEKPTLEGNKNLSVKESNALKLKNLEISLKQYNYDAEQSLNSFNELIAEKKRQYNALKNKNTQSANKILQQINRITAQRDNTQIEYERKMNNLEKRIDKMNSVDFKRAEQRMTKQEEYRKQANDLIGDTSTWTDKKLGIQYQINTFKRNLRDIVKGVDGKADIQRADAIYNEYQGKYDINEAKLKEEFNRLAEPFRNRKLTRQEEVYTQMLGELRHNPSTTLKQDMIDSYYNKNKNKIDVDKVNQTIEDARKLYDELFERINDRLRKQGMKELEYRRGYFPHFTEEKQSMLAKLFDWKIKNDQIPTDIAGLTELNNPERSWQSFNKHREGDTTDYNFSKGFDTYVHGALDWIYHIEDIQKRRALENEIRYQHSEEGVKQKIEEIYNNPDLDADEVQTQIEAVYGVAKNPLNNFVTDLRNSTNNLAGKKSTLDRSLEYSTNRQIYSTVTNLSNRVSGNMIAGSISSALTNFIPITQSWSQVSPVSSLKALGETIKSAIKDDGTIAKSTFLTNRLVKAENLYKSNWDKAADKVAIMTDTIDSITSQVVWRAKYNENIKAGMSEFEAIKDADQFAEGVIAGRSRGNEPTLFNSKNPITKMFTAFQLEVNNQYHYMFKDMPIDVGSKSKAKLMKGYATMFVGAYVYNALYSSLVGRDVAFDPIGLLEGILKELGIGGDDDDENEKTASEKFTAITEDLVQQLPFVGGLFGGGRVPISAAIPYENPIEMVKGTGEDLLNLFDEEKSERALKDLTSEWLKPVVYLALPFGGGQINKTIQGLSMYDEDLPVAGSYTNGGDLRFTADESTWGKVQAGLFGRWASDSAQEYVDSGFKTVKKNNIDELVDLGMTSTEYRKYRKGLKDAGTSNEDKIDYINSLDVPIEHKNIMANNVLDRDYKVDMSDYTTYEEFDFSYKNPEKYEWLVENDISYYDYAASKESKEAYNWAYENPEKYKVAKAVTDDLVTYKQLTSEINELAADKDGNGKSISGSRKNKVISYVNSLDLLIPQKAMLIRNEYSSFDDYNNDIVDYVIDLNVDYDEKKTILEELDMKVSSDGTVSW